jgi:hypothetical protein
MNSQFSELIFSDSLDNLKSNHILNSYTRSLYSDQLKELAVCRDVTIKGDERKIQEYANELSKSVNAKWVYYPWLNSAYEILDEKEFVEVRTNRNQLKITPEEQQQLSKSTIAIAGLSVGNSVALTLAMERVGGHLILADYDELELSNLNRLRTGIPQIGLHKGVIAKRQIAELDPYIKVTLFDEGVTDKTITSFLNKNVDILVEVCDSLDLKLSLRERAKEIETPVIMDTNDRGMIDIERFDLEPDRPIFHGFLEDLNMTNEELKKPENKVSLVQKIVGADISERLKKSIPEIGKTISSWPQLASGVMLGGAVTTNICRRILLNQHKKSGRFYVDFEQIIGA